MDFSNLGWNQHAELVKHIAACRGREFAPITKAEVEDFLANLEWCDAVAVVKALCAEKTIPQNVLGELGRIAKERRDYKRGKDGDDCKWRTLTPAEYRYYNRHGEVFCAIVRDHYNDIGTWEKSLGAVWTLYIEAYNGVKPQGWNFVYWMFTNDKRIPILDCQVHPNQTPDEAEVLITRAPVVSDDEIDKRISLLDYYDSRLLQIREERGAVKNF